MQSITPCLWFDGTAAQQDSPLPFWDAPCHDLRVMVVNGLARVANESRKVVALRDFLRDGFPAFAAKLHGRHAGREASAHG